MRKKICFITGSRADDSPVAPVIKAISYMGQDISFIRTQGLFGHEPYLKNDLRLINPDMVVLLGDRYETLVSATVCAVLGIPIAHLSGGDVTLGSIDDSFRHAITKLAYWHFPICYPHAERIVQMGEDIDRVFTIGAPAVDLLVESRMSKDEIERELGRRLEGHVTLVCLHPETNSARSIQDQVRELTQQLSGNTIIISGSNMDLGGEKINFLLRGWAQDNTHHALFFESYHQRLWTSLMHHANTLIGNSSGFVIEGMTLQRMKGDTAPNIIIVGDRQRGRYEEALRLFNPPGAMFHRVLYEEDLTPGGVTYTENEAIAPQIIKKYPFGEPGKVASKIADILATIAIPETTRKEFHEY